MSSDAPAVASTVTLLVVSGFLAACNDAFHFDVAASPDGGGVEPASDAGSSDAPGDAMRGCTSDATCGGLRCHVPSGVCAGCLQDTDCSGPRAKCHPTAGICVECLNGPDCGARQGCDTVTNRCLDVCFDADDPCPAAGFVCDRDRALCIECKTSASCAGSSSGPRCDVPIGRCVECAGNAQCPSSKPVCDRRTGRCEGCVFSPTCGTGAVCDPSTLACRNAP